MNFKEGFDFLGYWFSPAGLSIARKTVERMLDKVARLYEQGADDVRIETYLKHWCQWVRTGVKGVLTRFGCWFGGASVWLINGDQLPPNEIAFLKTMTDLTILKIRCVIY